ncbi:PREDICTED: acidic repeat-containing protein-like [Branchiostoma belcheri]|uniref:Acidic repeat-containing protein-like n=1 Tax=Branchiostoma belcheri TaxID=7741 RepID=A0A6P4YJ33_BRABE|nr:PREDICTED: acidic repeat-containing protein-like [Branchiostoma belcheri]
MELIDSHFVKTVGPDTYTTVLQDATVDELINKISKMNKIPPKTQRILYASKQLQYGQGKYLSDYHLQNESNLFVVLRLPGGGNTNSGMSGIASRYPDIGNTNTGANNIGGNNTRGNTEDSNTGDDDTHDLPCMSGDDDTEDSNTEDNDTDLFGAPGDDDTDLFGVPGDDDTDLFGAPGDDDTDDNNHGDDDTESAGIVSSSVSKSDDTDDNNSTDSNTGGNNTLSSPPPQNRKQLDEDVETTDAPDMISWEDDPNTPRAKMSCGHAITPETLTTYCKSLLR